MAKIGEGSLSAAARQGLGEIRAAFYPESNVAQRTEYGMYGTLTPGEVAENRRGNPLDLEEEKPMRESVLQSRMREAETREVSTERGLERE